MKKNILILGGTGFIGNYLAHYLNETFNVITTSSTGKGATIKFQLTDNKILKEVINKYNIEVIINTIVSYSEQFENCININAIGIRNILREIDENIKFINISSVFADNKNKYNNIYSLTKSIGDDLIIFDKAICKATILRFGQIFDNQGIARNSQKGFYYFIDSIKENKPINLFGNPYVTRSYIPVEIVCRTIEYSIVKNIYGVHNVIMPDLYSNLELLKILSSYSNYDLNKIVFDGSKKITEYHIPKCSSTFQPILAKKNCTTYFRKLFETE